MVYKCKIQYSYSSLFIDTGVVHIDGKIIDYHCCTYTQVNDPGNIEGTVIDVKYRCTNM